MLHRYESYFDGFEPTVHSGGVFDYSALSGQSARASIGAHYSRAAGRSYITVTESTGRAGVTLEPCTGRPGDDSILTR